ncbi:MAG: FAD-binding protein [Syntrophorhabdales bacterium]|jgi:electron transfer flavoprotein alpha subunit
MAARETAGPKRKKRGKPRLIPETCIACGRCEAVCPVNAIRYDTNGEPIIDFDACIGCGKCVKSCPAAALKMAYPEAGSLVVENVPEEALPEKQIRAKEKAKGVWVFIEQRDGAVRPVSWQLLGKGAGLAKDLSDGLSAVILGSRIGRIAEEAFARGAGSVYMMDDPVLAQYRTGPYAEGIVATARKYRPAVFLLGATAIGRDLAGAVATKLETGLTADCTGLSIDKERRILEQTRPAFGGNIMATIICEHARPQMATVRPDVFSLPPLVPGRTGPVFNEPCPVVEAEVLTLIKQVIPVEKADVDIAAADIIVSGGRGMASVKNFAMLGELARLLGGTVAGSRSAVDAGFVGYERQVGQTGRTVRPKLYVACGISGAVQHLVGMREAEYVIAINNDEHAPIFEVADLGIVGDALEILPGLIEALQARKAAKASKGQGL